MFGPLIGLSVYTNTAKVWKYNFVWESSVYQMIQVVSFLNKAPE
jgi:hypothetical protein